MRCSFASLRTRLRVNSAKDLGAHRARPFPFVSLRASAPARRRDKTLPVLVVKLHYRGLIASTRVFSQLELLDPKKRLHIGSSELSVGPRFIVGPKEIQGEIVMHTVHSDRRQIFWLATLLAVVFTFILAACGSSTG